MACCTAADHVTSSAVESTRPLFWGIAGVWVFYAVAALAIVVFVQGVAARVLAWRRAGRGRLPALDASRLWSMARNGLLGLRIFRGDAGAGLMHLLIAWGFLGLFAGTALLSIHEWIVPFLVGDVYLIYSATMEVFGLLLLAGLLWAGVRRYVVRTGRLSRTPGDLVPLLWLGLVGVTGFLLEGARLGAGGAVRLGDWSFVGEALTAIRLPRDQRLVVYQGLWWTHALLSLGLVAWIPRSKLLHTLVAPLNLMVESSPEPSPMGRGQGEGTEPEPTLRARDLLAIDACTRCGRCVDACPSRAAGEPLSPREVVQALRTGPVAAATQTGPGRDLWYCTACLACREVCPVEVTPLELVARLRGAVIEEGSAVPPKLGETLERLHKYQNPWVSKKGQKAAWARDLELEAPELEPAWLYFVGCTTSLDTRAQAIARSIATVLARCGVAFGTLGKKEPCCGDIGRRVGERGLFEDQREATAALLDERGARRVVTSSPHCFDTIARAYGPGREVLHYSQLLARLIDEGKLELARASEGPTKATYHDPCFLGRHNGVYDEPRRVLAAVPGIELVEMEAHGASSVCCGGGGGRMWQTELPDKGDLAGRRIGQAVATGARLLVTACPLCLVMLEDARKTAGLEDRIEVVDLCELVARHLAAAPEGAGE